MTQQLNPRLRILLEDARHERLQGQQLINLQKYSNAYGVDVAAHAIKKGISRKCRGNLKMPDLVLDKACPELRSKQSEADSRLTSLRVNETKMRNLHQGNLKNMAAANEAAQRNLMLIQQQSMMDRILTGNFTKQDMRSAMFQGGRDIISQAHARYQRDPAGFAYSVFSAMATAAGGMPGLFTAASIGATLEAYRTLREKFPQFNLPTLYGVENWPRSAFNDAQAFARAFMGSQKLENTPTPMPTPAPVEEPLHNRTMARESFTHQHEFNTAHHTDTCPPSPPPPTPPPPPPTPTPDEDKGIMSLKLYR